MNLFNKPIVLFWMIVLFIVGALTLDVKAQENAQTESIDKDKVYKILVSCKNLDGAELDEIDTFIKCSELNAILDIKLIFGDKRVDKLADANMKIEIGTRKIADNIVRVDIHYVCLENANTPCDLTVNFDYKLPVNDSFLVGFATQIVGQLGFLRQAGRIYVDSMTGDATVVIPKPDGVSTPPVKQKNWYLSPSLYANYYNSKGESSSLSTDAGAEYVYSKPKYKYKVYGGFHYQSDKIEGYDSYQATSMNAGGSMIRSLKNNHWSFALQVNAFRSPVADNVKVAAESKIGVEYILVPFVDNSQANLVSIRYTMGPKHYELVEPNQNDETSTTLLLHSLGVNGSFNLSKLINKNPDRRKQNLNVNVGLSASSELNSFRYGALYFNTKISWQPTDRITIGPNYNLSMTKAYPNRPKVSSSGGAIEDIKNAGKFGSVKQSFTIGISVKFGSSGIASRDKRWE